jgi:hypothetical protein
VRRLQVGKEFLVQFFLALREPTMSIGITGARKILSRRGRAAISMAPSGLKHCLDERAQPL